MAMEALQTTKKMSCRCAAKLYDIPESTLCDRINSRPPCLDIRPNCYKLTDLEEIVIIRHILDIDTGGFAP